MNRRRDVDQLRILATLVVFLFHGLMVFVPFPYHVKNAEKSALATYLVIFFDAWMMPLFFVLAGFGARFGLAKRGPAAFVWERALRLLVPLYGAGVILLPPQYAFELWTNRGFEGSFFAGMGQWFTTLHLSPSPFFLGFWPAHLWFLKFLFLVSVVCLPLLLFVNRDSSRALGERLARDFAKPWGVLVPIVGGMLFNAVLAPTPGKHTWTSLGVYIFFFSLGIAQSSSQAFTDALIERRTRLLIGGLAAYGLFIIAFKTGFYDPTATPVGTFPRFVGDALVMANRMFWTLALLGFGAKHLTGAQPIWDRFAEAAYPFYILHQTVLLVVAFFVVKSDWGVWTKWAVIIGVSFPIIFALHQFVVRRFALARLFFGAR